MKKIAEWEVLDHGLCHSQYFQGCGTSFTPWDDCFTGIGSSGQEALEDALEQAAQFYEWSAILEEDMLGEVSDMEDPEVTGQPEEGELWHFVSVRFKAGSLYEVSVGNIGTVYLGNDEADAEGEYDDYVERSKEGLGRAGGEAVVLMKDNEIWKEHQGSLAESNEDSF